MVTRWSLIIWLALFVLCGKGELVKYPCNYCGCCSVWLAAFEPDTGLDTLEDIVAACKKYYNCKLVGREVIKDEVELEKVLRGELE